MWYWTLYRELRWEPICFGCSGEIIRVPRQRISFTTLSVQWKIPLNFKSLGTSLLSLYNTDLTLLLFKEDGKYTCNYTVGDDLCHSWAKLRCRLCTGHILYDSSLKIQNKYAGLVLLLLLFYWKKMKFWDISTRAKVSTHISLVIKRLVFPIYFSRHLKMRKEKQNSDMPCCFIIINL